MKLSPFFTFYGGKYRAAPRYPTPRHDTIVEPFAGSAGYSLRYHDRKVVLVERDPAVAGTWRYLLRVGEQEVLTLPDIPPGGSVDDIPGLCQEARWLIGWACGRGLASPRKTQSAWISNYVAGNYGNGCSPCIAWGDGMRRRIAGQLSAIRHWTLIEGDYTAAPDVPATWFVDPPYSDKGRHYRFGSSGLNYPGLAGWCRTRKGQTIVCENTGATWLPFQHFLDIKASEAKMGGKVSREAIYLSDSDGQPWLP